MAKKKDTRPSFVIHYALSIQLYTEVFTTILWPLSENTTIIDVCTSS